MIKSQLEFIKEEFIYPKSHYYGDSFAEGFLLNNNLQEFAHKVSYIAGLHSNGKISSEQAYLQIEDLWQNFKDIHDDTQTYF